MSNEFCVNKSGYSVPVWDRPGWPDIEGSQRIGNIYNREAFGADWNWGGDGVFNHIVFRNSSGQLTGGWLINGDENGNEILSGSNWVNVFKGCTEYPYGTITINGTTYKTFKFRRQETVYKGDASVWGTVAAGMRVACLSSLSGNSYPYWKAINYIERSSDGAWIKVEGAGYSYGFVNTGLEDGSMPTSISMYGNW